MELKKILSFLLVLSTVGVSGCSREWIPTPDPNTCKWHNQSPEPDPEPDPDPEPEPEENWTVVEGAGCALGDMTVLEQSASTFMRGYWPDGKLIPIKKGNQWQLFWSEATDALTIADTPYPEDHIASLTASAKVWGKEFVRIDGFNDGGSWFIGIFPLDDKGHYVGFFHAESHWSVGSGAHKSIGVAYSDDYGATWRDPAPILTVSTPKPESAAWTGLGDGCVIWDSVSSRYICYYQARANTDSNALCMAASSDKNGSAGTWKKWDGSDFTIEGCDPATGLGGADIAIEGLSATAGCNPSVMWNSYLGKWVMAYATWAKRVVITYSDDAIRWSKPVKILGSIGVPAWYPNLIGSEGDLKGGEIVKVYWSHNQGDDAIREIGCRSVKFIKE